VAKRGPASRIANVVTYEGVNTADISKTAGRALTLRVAAAFVLGGCASDANVQAIGTREQDEAQTPCCYPHLPDGVCVRYVRAFTTQRGVPSRWHRRCCTAFLISIITMARSSHPPISDRLTARRGRARHYFLIPIAVVVRHTTRSAQRKRRRRRAGNMMHQGNRAPRAYNIIT